MPDLKDVKKKLKLDKLAKFANDQWNKLAEKAPVIDETVAKVAGKSARLWSKFKNTMPLTAKVAPWAAAAVVGFWAVAVATPMLFAITGPVATLAVIGTCIAATAAAVKDAIELPRDMDKKETWQNEAGQTLESTRLQRYRLENVQKLAGKFNAAAEPAAANDNALDKVKTIVRNAADMAAEVTVCDAGKLGASDTDFQFAVPGKNGKKLIVKP